MSGSIYNKGNSAFKGIEFTGSDPEYVATLFLKEGPEFVTRLNGDFAIYIYQPGKNNGFLFRDHLGIRPLAYMIDHGNLIFSSDIIGLCKAVSAGKTIDPDYLLGYFKYIDYRKTPDKRVKKLLPGHYLAFSESGSTLIKYWYPEKIQIDKTLRYETMISDLDTIVRDSVAIRCDRRFTAGSHVSSGLDSGLVAALARANYLNQETFFGFSWSPSDFTHKNTSFDERNIVRKLSEKANIAPVFSTLDTRNFLKRISCFFENQGFFSEDHNLQQVVEHHTNLIFSGWGGDEFISTGHRGIDSDLLFRGKWQLFCRRNPFIIKRKQIRHILRSIILPALGILDRPTAKGFREDARYVKKQYKKSDNNSIRNFYFYKARRKLHLGLLNLYHLQNRTENWTINGYRNGVEYRYPLLDRQIIEYMLKVPSEILGKPDSFRPILREIGKNILPEEILCSWEKRDPVAMANDKMLIRNAAITLMDETSEWKLNPDLYFFDFDLLEKDIRKYRDNTLYKDFEVLARSLVYMKAIHEFTLDYRK